MLAIPARTAGRPWHSTRRTRPDRATPPAAPQPHQPVTPAALHTTPAPATPVSSSRRAPASFISWPVPGSTSQLLTISTAPGGPERPPSVLLWLAERAVATHTSGLRCPAKGTATCALNLRSDNSALIDAGLPNSSSPSRDGAEASSTTTFPHGDAAEAPQLNYLTWISAGVRSGCSARISSVVIPSATIATTVATGKRSPRMQSSPPMTAGSVVMRS